MEREFQCSFLSEEASSDATYNAVFTDGTLQSLIPVSTNYSSSSNFNFFSSEDFPTLITLKSQLVETSDSSQLTPFNFKTPTPTPKNEPFIELTQPPFDFFSKPATLLSTDHISDSPFNQLPQLTDSLPSSSLPTRNKRGRVDSPPQQQTLDSILQTYNFPKKPSSSSSSSSRNSVIPHSELARQRRQKISEKTRCLQKLMPWDKKMDTASMLEEAYKYVQFLQAQITALQTMPCHSSATTTVNGSRNDGRFVAGLGSLNRQQLLQVLVNSPVAQTMLYSQGFCVFSMEQLVLLNKVAVTNPVLLHFPYSRRC